jgi:hypothetical protein
MIKRALVMFAAPALLGAGLLTATPAAWAATVPDAPVECRLQPVRDGRASYVQCREHGAYVHWIRCRNHPDSRATEDTIREFVGTRSLLVCEPGSRLVSHSIGA